jgi:hypothetical protein
MPQENFANSIISHFIASSSFLTLSLPHPVQTGPWPTYLKKSQIIQIASIYVYKLVLESWDQFCHRLIFLHQTGFVLPPKHDVIFLQNLGRPIASI